MQRKAPSSTVAAQGMVRDLVRQFSDPLDFYRELIQNSIDAGSNRIDVRLESVPAGKGRVLAAIQVSDDGEGMDERIIDDYLLVLFKSTKEGDLTKIGKFGIGFVSVFALEPKQVRLCTGKSGESWRIDFPSWRKYEKYRMSGLREGTSVELTKELSTQEYARLVSASREKIRYWCKHADTRIYFSAGGKDAVPALINEPFGLEGESLRWAEEGTELALAFSSEAEPFYGFYNRGLTLKEGKRAFVPGVALKVKSRYLEHTLTRDNVIEDDNYRKILGVLARLAKKELARKLSSELSAVASEAAAAAAAGDAAALARLSEQWALRLPYLKWLLSGFVARWKRSDWRIFPTVAGVALTIREVHRLIGNEGGRLYFDDQATPVSRELARNGTAVLASGPWLAEIQALNAKTETVRASSAFILPKPLDDREILPGLRSFLATLRWAEARTGAKYSGIQAADFAYPGSPIKERMFVTMRNPGALGSVSERPRPSLLGLRRERLHALVNAEEPFVKELALLHETRPGLAVYLCLKAMHLSDGAVPAEREEEYCNLAARMEGRLLRAALELDAASPARPGAKA